MPYCSGVFVLLLILPAWRTKKDGKRQQNNKKMNIRAR
jgi:hypothetical protein